MDYAHWVEPWPLGAWPDAVLLTVVDQLDGRVLKHVCRDEAHAAECLPVLEAMLARGAGVVLSDGAS
jgi:hypothetical protein